MSCGLGSRARPSVEFLSCEWLLTFGTPPVDRRKRQTSTATPAKPGGLPVTLGTPYVLGLLAELEAAEGDDERALSSIDQGLATARKTGEHVSDCQTPSLARRHPIQALSCQPHQGRRGLQ